MTNSLKLALAAAATLAIGATAALAQDQQQQSPWLKVCNFDQNAKKNVCLITQEMRTNTGQFLASAAIREIEGEQRRIFLTSVPPGMQIQAGVQIQVDGGEPKKANYQICFPNACYAEYGFEGDGFINELKRGGRLRLTTFNQQGKPVPFEMTLIGFTATYDGPGLDPQGLRQQQEELQAELNRKAQEARDRLIEAQREAEQAAN